MIVGRPCDQVGGGRLDAARAARIPVDKPIVSYGGSEYVFPVDPSNVLFEEKQPYALGSFLKARIIPRGRPANVVGPGHVLPGPCRLGIVPGGGAMRLLRHCRRGRNRDRTADPTG